MLTAKKATFAAEIATLVAKIAMLTTTVATLVARVARLGARIRTVAATVGVLLEMIGILGFLHKKSRIQSREAGRLTIAQHFSAGIRTHRSNESAKRTTEILR